MNTSSRFVVATHILTLLALRRWVRCEITTSAQIAESVNTNPVVVRRILGRLRDAGLVASQTGPHGGSTLIKDPEHITLRDVYLAVEEGELFHLHYAPPSAACPVGVNIQDTLCCSLEDATKAMTSVLAQRTIAELGREVTAKTGIDRLIEEGLSFEEIWARYDFQAGELVSREVN